MRLDVLEKIHQGHLGTVKCRSGARATVWWPRLSIEVEEMVKNCFLCAEHTFNRREPLWPIVRPARSWETVGPNLFELNGKQYLIFG